MTGIDRSFEAELTKAFAATLPSQAIEREVRAGPLTLRVGFQTAQLAEAYLPAFVPEEPHRPDLSIRVVTAAELDLSALVPVPSEQGRAFAFGRFFAVWHPDRQSVLYLLDRGARRALVWLPQN